MSSIVPNAGPGQPGIDLWLFGGVRDAQQIVEAWREQYNLDRPHSALGVRSIVSWQGNCLDK